MKMNNIINKVCVVGLGYIGLPTAVIIASNGTITIGCDTNRRIVSSINACKSPISEPNVEEALKDAVSKGTLKAQEIPCEADIFIIAVPTPLSVEKKEPDLQYVFDAVKSICPFLKEGNLVIIESTIPVGTTDKASELISQERPDLITPKEGHKLHNIFIAHCPERVLPGNIMVEIEKNDRVIGGITPKCAALAKDLYDQFVTGNCLIATSARSAELTKLAENSFRDVNIAFANELSVICDSSGIDVWEIIKLANRHPRVNIFESALYKLGVTA